MSALRVVIIVIQMLIAGIQLEALFVLAGLDIQETLILHVMI